MSRRLLLVLLPALALAAAGGALWRDGEDGLRPLLRLRERVTEARTRVVLLEARAAELERDARSIRDDPLALEAAARSLLGMVRPGEVVVRLDAEGAP